MLAGWARSGGRHAKSVTMIDKLLESVSVPSLAVTVALYVPWSPNPGARRILPVAVPVPGLVVVTAMNVGPDAAKNVSALPSGAGATSAGTAAYPSTAA